MLVFRDMTWPRSNPESEVPVHHYYIRSFPEYLAAASTVPTLNTQHIATSASCVCRHTGTHKNGTLLHRVLASLLQLLLQHRCLQKGSCDAEQANSTFKQHKEDYSLQRKLCDELHVPRSKYTNGSNWTRPHSVWVKYFNPSTPNDHYSGRTTPLTSKVSFYIFIQQI